MGGALTAGDGVTLTASMSATGSAGLVIGGVELRRTDAGWALREGDQEVPVADADPFVIALGSTVAVGDASLTLQTPWPADPVGVYVSLDPGATLDRRSVSTNEPLPVDDALGDPLRTLAQARGVHVGSATDLWPPKSDPSLEALLGQQFDAFLLWDYALPRWVRDLRGDADALGAALDDHVATMVGRYRGLVHVWVVANEAVWGPGDAGNPRSELADTIWLDTLGPSCLDRVFLDARAADPDAVLLYNETGAEVVNDKSDFVAGLLGDLVGRGVPVDAVGLQFRVSAAAPPDPAAMQANFQRFGDLGLDVYVTELDVSLVGVDGTEDERLAKQAQVYVDVLDACLAVPACKSWTVFGFSDKYAWDELGDATPLLFDAQYAPKPAYFAVQDALR